MKRILLKFPLLERCFKLRESELDLRRNILKLRESDLGSRRGYSNSGGTISISEGAFLNSERAISIF
jgi:hypothetical protein